MKQVRTLILIVMALAILPWGAVAAAIVAKQVAPIVVVAMADQADAKLVAPRKCRGGFLPGAPCGLERWIGVEQVSLGRDAATVRCGLPLDWVGRGQVHAPPREPPRAV